MGKRIASSVVGILIFLGLCFWGPLAWAIGATVVAGLAAHEFSAAYRSAREHEADAKVLKRFSLNDVLLVAGLAFPLVAYEASRAGQANATLFALVPAVLVGVCSCMLNHYIHTGRALGRFRNGYGIVGFAYVGLLFSGLVLLRGVPGRVTVAPFGRTDLGAWIALYVATCVWMSDTWALFGGRQFGRNKLAPLLSPGKTYEGLIAGILGAIATGAVFGYWIHIPLIHGLAVGAIAGLVGPLGDLFESALKRELGVKDFGTVMPGHGGALDRFDSLLFVMPLAYLYLTLIARV